MSVIRPLASITGIAKRCDACGQPITETQEAIIAQLAGSSWKGRFIMVGFTHKQCPHWERGSAQA